MSDRLNASHVLHTNITQNFHFCVDKFDFGLIYFTCSTSEILCNVHIYQALAIYITANMLYLLRMELFSSPEKIFPSSGDNINKGNTFVHSTDPLPQSNSVNNY